MTDREKQFEIPTELRGKLSSFDKALSDVEQKLEPLLKASQVELNAKLGTLDKAKLDLVAAYSINSLFWMYLNVCGVNPKDHGVKQELDRIRSYMSRVKEIQDKEKAPSLDVKASKRFVKSALWQAAQKDINDKPDAIDSSPPDTASDNTHQESRGGKRKSEDNKHTPSKPHHKKSRGQGKRYMRQ